MILNTGYRAVHVYDKSVCQLVQLKTPFRNILDLTVIILLLFSWLVYIFGYRNSLSLENLPKYLCPHLLRRVFQID